MDEDDLTADILDDADLGLDEETKGRFRAAVSDLKCTGRGDDAGSAADRAWRETGAFEAEKAWSQLQQMGVADEPSARVKGSTTAEELLVAHDDKDATIAALAQELEKLAQELEMLRQQLLLHQPVEGTPPPSA